MSIQDAQQNSNNKTNDPVQDAPKSSGGSFWSPDAIIDEYAPKLKPYSTLVFLYYCRRANKDGECWPSIERTARDLNMSKNTVRRSNNELLGYKLIDIQERLNPNGMQTSHLVRIRLRPEKREGVPEREGVSEREEGGTSQGGGGVPERDPKEYTVEGKHSRRTVVPTTNEKVSTDYAPYGRSVGKRENVKRDLSPDTNGTANFDSSRPDNNTPYSPPAAPGAEANSDSESSRTRKNTPSPQAPATPPPEDEAGWVPESAMAVYDKQRGLLSLPALEDRMRQKFLREFETLRYECQIDRPTLRAVIRRMLLRAQVPLSPLYAHNDVQKKPHEHRPMTHEELLDWWHDYRNGIDEEDSAGWEVRWDYDGPVVYEGISRWIGTPPSSAPRWVHRRYAEMKEMAKTMTREEIEAERDKEYEARVRRARQKQREQGDDDDLIPGQRVV